MSFIILLISLLILFDFSPTILKLFILSDKILIQVVIKPISEGSSIDVKISQNKKGFLKNIKKLFHKYDELLLETFIGGKEIQVANGKLQV